MPRPPRLDVPDMPQHVVQRGNNKLPCFLDDVDRQTYLQLLSAGLRRYDCALHAYVLMDNHAHLLLTPVMAGSVSRLMQTFGRNYASHFNQRHGRSGTLWEGRFWACLVDRDEYLLACCRYIELNPVRAGICDSPGDFDWSSYRANAEGAIDQVLTPHPTYMALGRDARSCRIAYRAMALDAVSEVQLRAIRDSLRQRGAFGSEKFRLEVERTVARFAGTRPAHRPRKAPAA